MLLCSVGNFQHRLYHFSTEYRLNPGASFEPLWQLPWTILSFQRVDSKKVNLGLSSFKGMKPTKKETEIAKNYLSEPELNILNRIVTAFLEIAEIQALNQTPMYMKDWIEQLDTFLKMTKKDVLKHAGSISHP